MEPDSDEALVLRRRVEALESELRRERAMFAGGPVVVFRWVATEGWPVEYVSSNVGDLFGWTASDFATGTVRYVDTVHPEDLQRIADEVASHSESGAPNFEQDYRIVRRDGAVRWLYDFTVIVRDEAGQVTHYEGYVLDISARREAEAAVRERDEQLRRAQKMEALGRLAGGIAHDFNNLLTAVSGYTELASEQVAADAPAQASLSQVRASVERAAALTTQLLAFSRRQVLEPRLLDLVARVAEARALLSPVLGGQLELVDRSEAAPLPVRVDASQLEQVVVNLLLNARDALPEGGRIEVATTRRELDRPLRAVLDDLIPAGPWAVLSVRDDGVGMDDATVARAFEPFFTTKGAEGNGLGLATVYGVVKQSHGYVRLETAPGKGTTFEVWLPLLENESPVAEESAVPVEAAPIRAHETVLVVEDDDDIREVVRRSLEARGFIVIEARDGIDALERLEGRPAPDVVVTDLVMPRLGGVALAEELERRGVDVPVLFVSGYSDAVMPLGQSRRVAFLQKPYTGESLVRAMRELLTSE